MRTDVAAIRVAVNAAHRENRARIASLGDADMERPTPHLQWRVRQPVLPIAEDNAGLYAAE